PVIMPVVVVCALILPANFSTAAILFVTCVVIMFVGRISLKYIFSLFGLGVVAIIMIFLFAKTAPDLFPRAETWVNRVDRFLNKEKEDPDGNYQIEQAKIAIVKGKIIGQGPGQSEQRNFLPHPYSDFIFAIILEEYGIIGGGIVVLLYIILFFRVVRIALKCQGNFGTFLVIGIGFSLIFQAFINMAVAVQILPVTGQTLPLISMGGTSIWFTSIAIGMILAVSRRLEIETKDGTEVEVLTDLPVPPVPASTT
ncbi:MAG: FtsW/RodA/SpoVE family cell cycle protein, partial [Syntrophothermus sp.]